MTLFCQWAKDRALTLEETADQPARDRVHSFCTEIRAGILITRLFRNGIDYDASVTTLAGNMRRRAERGLEIGGEYSSATAHEPHGIVFGHHHGKVYRPHSGRRWF